MFIISFMVVHCYCSHRASKHLPRPLSLPEFFVLSLPTTFPERNRQPTSAYVSANVSTD